MVAQYFIPPNFRADACIDDAVVIEIDGAVKYDGSSFGKCRANNRGGATTRS